MIGTFEDLNGRRPLEHLNSADSEHIVLNDTKKILTFSGLWTNLTKAATNLEPVCSSRRFPQEYHERGPLESN